MSERSCRGCGTQLPHVKPSTIARGRGKFCSIPCARSHHPSSTPYERVQRYVVKSDEGCWDWTAATNKGYGVVGNHSAHRVMYEHAYGSIPDGMYVLHKCDNRKCCRPDHLFLGTHLDNIKDMLSKGRGVKGSTVGSAVLSEDEVRNIRNRLNEKNNALAKEFGVSAYTISEIKRFETWKHVTV